MDSDKTLEGYEKRDPNQGIGDMRMYVKHDNGTVCVEIRSAKYPDEAIVKFSMEYKDSMWSPQEAEKKTCRDAIRHFTEVGWNYEKAGRIGARCQKAMDSITNKQGEA